MYAFIFYTHSGVRYLVLLAAIAAIAYYLFGLATKREFDKPARIVGAAFTGLLDLQLVAGAVLWLYTPTYTQLWGHIVMMLAAITVAHVILGKNKRSESPSHGMGLAGVIVPLILIVGGIMAIGRPIYGTTPVG